MTGRFPLLAMPLAPAPSPALGRGDGGTAAPAPTPTPVPGALTRLRKLSRSRNGAAMTLPCPTWPRHRDSASRKLPQTNQRATFPSLPNGRWEGAGLRGEAARVTDAARAGAAKGSQQPVSASNQQPALRSRPNQNELRRRAGPSRGWAKAAPIQIQGSSDGRDTRPIKPRSEGRAAQ